MSLPPVPEGFVLHRGPLTYREFAERTKADVRRAMREVRHPAGDILAAAYYHAPLPGQAEASRLFRAPLHPSWFSSRGAKDELAARMAGMARVLRARKFAWVTTQWLVVEEYDTDEELEERMASDEVPPGQPMPSEHPDRREMVALMVYDAERVEQWFSFITRRPGKPPRFEKWNVDPRYGEVPAVMERAAGVMHEPLQEAMR